MVSFVIFLDVLDVARFSPCHKTSLGTREKVIVWRTMHWTLLKLKVTRKNGNVRSASFPRIPKPNSFFTKPCIPVPFKKRIKRLRANCRNISARLVRRFSRNHHYEITLGSILEKNPFHVWSVRSHSREDRTSLFIRGYAILRRNLWTKLVVGGTSSVRIAKKASTQSKWQFNLLIIIIIIIEIASHKWHICLNNFRSETFVYKLHIHRRVNFKSESYKFAFYF